MLSDLFAYDANQVYASLILLVLIILAIIPITVLALRISKVTPTGLASTGLNPEVIPVLNNDNDIFTEEKTEESKEDVVLNDQAESFDVKDLILDYKTDDEAKDKIATPRQMTLRLRLNSSTDSIKEKYSLVRNFLESYRIRERSAKHRDVFYVLEEKVLTNDGNVLNKNVVKKVAMITIKRKQLLLSLNVDNTLLKDYESLVKSNIEVVGRRYEGYNLNISLSTDNKVNQAIKLMTELLEKLNVSKKRYHKPTDYKKEYSEELSSFELRGFGYLLRDSISYEESNQYKDSLSTKAIVINKLNEEPISNPIPFSISLDELSKEFKNGDKITLDILKEKGLAPIISNKLIITDGTKLDKKLFVSYNCKNPNTKEK